MDKVTNRLSFQEARTRQPIRRGYASSITQKSQLHVASYLSRRHYSNSQLANMLSNTYRDAGALRRDLGLERKRAEHSDRILAILKVVDTPPSNGAASIDLADVPKNPDVCKFMEE
jgi:hypothetical protein